MIWHMNKSFIGIALSSVMGLGALTVTPSFAQGEGQTTPTEGNRTEQDRNPTSPQTSPQTQPGRTPTNQQPLPQTQPGSTPTQRTTSPQTQPQTTSPQTQPSNQTGNGQPQENQNLVAIAASNEKFSTLVQAVQAAGLQQTLAGQGPYTVFAPSNEAFAQLPNGAVEYLLQPENQDTLRRILMYHVVPGEVMANELRTGTVDALYGGLAVRVTGDNRVIVNNASVTQPNIQASNGVIHEVNRVLMPASIRRQLTTALRSQPQPAQPSQQNRPFTQPQQQPQPNQSQPQQQPQQPQ
ncbi:MAG: fasciclin domain-containing protein [Chloroflexaceae bacterium]|nr:fasciclin domain-containing protein [Chloroflexaceae bacterium]